MQKNHKAHIERNFMKIIGNNSRRMVEPSLLPIYLRPDGSDIGTDQIGTGFLIAVAHNCILVTARHVLYGHGDDEDPFTRHIVFNGRLRGLCELKSGEIFRDCNHDLAAVCVNELGLDRCLPISSFLPVDATCNLIAIHGFLARDFRRQITTGTLRPQPNLYINRRFVHGSGYTGILYPKSKNRDTRTGRVVHAPRPAGMSGCPMLDAVKLALGRVSIIGVFTDYLQLSGRAFGESAPKALSLLKHMQKHQPSQRGRHSPPSELSDIGDVTEPEHSGRAYPIDRLRR